MEVKYLISQYSASSKKNRSHVIYCFDCDEYQHKPEDLRFLENAKSYCDSKGYGFVWFCKDIEQGLYRKASRSQPEEKTAAVFKEKKSIMKVLEQRQELKRKINCS